MRDEYSIVFGACIYLLVAIFIAIGVFDIGRLIRGAKQGSKENQKSLIRLLWFAACLACAIELAPFIFGFLFMYGEQQELAERRAAARSEIDPPNRPYERQLVMNSDQMIEVPTAELRYRSFLIKREWRHCQVVGTFKSSEGSEGVSVSVTTSASISNIKNGFQSEQYYSSGIVKAGKFDIDLKPGFYFVLLDNRESKKRQQSVQLKLELYADVFVDK